MSVDLHLLTKGAASDETVHKGEHTRPPIIVSQCGVRAEEPHMAGGKGQVYHGHKVMAGVGGQTKAVLEVKIGMVIAPVGRSQMRK